MFSAMCKISDVQEGRRDQLPVRPLGHALRCRAGGSRCCCPERHPARRTSPLSASGGVGDHEEHDVDRDQRDRDDRPAPGATRPPNAVRGLPDGRHCPRVRSPGTGSPPTPGACSRGRSACRTAGTRCRSRGRGGDSSAGCVPAPGAEGSRRSSCVLRLGLICSPVARRLPVSAPLDLDDSITTVVDRSVAAGRSASWRSRRRRRGWPGRRPHRRWCGAC